MTREVLAAFTMADMQRLDIAEFKRGKDKRKRKKKGMGFASKLALGLVAPAAIVGGGALLRMRLQKGKGGGVTPPAPSTPRALPPQGGTSYQEIYRTQPMRPGTARPTPPPPRTSNSPASRNREIQAGTRQELINKFPNSESTPGKGFGKPKTPKPKKNKRSMIADRSDLWA